MPIYLWEPFSTKSQNKLYKVRYCFNVIYIVILNVFCMLVPVGEGGVLGMGGLELLCWLLHFCEAKWDIFFTILWMERVYKKLERRSPQSEASNNRGINIHSYTGMFFILMESHFAFNNNNIRQSTFVRSDNLNIVSKAISFYLKSWFNW